MRQIILKHHEFIILFLIVLLGIGLRLYRFDGPIADWHSWRQADTSSVSRNFVKNGIDLLRPTYHDLSSIPSGLDNPNGYRFVEFPIYNFLQATAYNSLKIFTLEEAGRIVTILSSMLSVVFLYFIVKRKIGKKEALFSSMFYSFMPFSVFYGRVLLPDPLMVMLILGGILFFDLWVDRKSKGFYLLSLLFTAASLLVKPYALFFVIPFIFIAFRKWGFGMFGKIQLWLFALISILPFILWRYWILQFPEGIPASEWLFNANNIRFKGAFFYWIFGERLSRLILGYTGVFLLLLGLLKSKGEKDFLFIYTFIASSLAYLFTIAGGNVQHDYYQILIIPAVSMLLGRGVVILMDMRSMTEKIIPVVMLPLIIISMLSFSWYYVKDYFNINNRDIVEAGKAADTILPPHAKVIAPYNGDTSFLYQTNRSGWPVFLRPIDEMVPMGAEYMVIVSPTQSDLEGFGKDYYVVASASSYLIIKLK
jgi:hypothetical protein